MRLIPKTRHNSVIVYAQLLRAPMKRTLWSIRVLSSQGIDVPPMPMMDPHDCHLCTRSGLLPMCPVCTYSTTTPSNPSSASGYRISSPSSFSTSTFEITRFRYHFRSAGITYHGANSVEVRDSTASKARM